MSSRILIHNDANIYVIIRLNIVFVAFSNELVNSDICPTTDLWSYIIIALQDTQHSHQIPLAMPKF